MTMYSMTVPRGKYGLAPQYKAWTTVWVVEPGQVAEAVARVQVSVSAGDVYPPPGWDGPYVTATDTDGTVYRALDLTWDQTAYHYHADAGIARRGEHVDRTAFDRPTLRHIAACACRWTGEGHILDKKARLQLSEHIDTATRQEATPMSSPTDG